MATTAVTFKGYNSVQLDEILDKYKPTIASAIPTKITPERMMRIFHTVISINPKIKECTQGSVIGAIMESAVLGLDPTPQMGQVAFIPRWSNKKKVSELQFMIEYRGYLTLARRSGNVTNVEARVVFQYDEFSYSYGLNPTLEHKPSLNGSGEKGTSGEIIAAYCVFTFKSGEKYFEVMSIEDIEKRMHVSPYIGKDSIWQRWKSDMCLKTVIRHAIKYVQLDTREKEGVAADEGIIDIDSFASGKLDVSEVKHPDLEPIETEVEMPVAIEDAKEATAPDCFPEPKPELEVEAITEPSPKQQAKDAVKKAQTVKASPLKPPTRKKATADSNKPEVCAICGKPGNLSRYGDDRRWICEDCI